MTRIIGAGFGGGGGKGGSPPGGGDPPTESNDSLQSIQYGSVLDLISEGEIEGVEDGAKGVFLDDTPIVSKSGVANFKNYTLVFRNGTQNQSHIPGLSGTESENGVNIIVRKDSPVTRTITNSQVDRVRVTVSFPSIRFVEDDGDIVGTSISLEIQVQYNGGGFNKIAEDTITGKSSSQYLRDYVFELNGAFPVDIRLIRVTADADSVKMANDFYWYSYTEIIDERLRYPNSALAFLRFNSRDFNSIPSRKYLVRGIKVKLPSNATVDTTNYLGRVTYTGVWDGTFGAATWCNDPAWCLWDLLTNTRYGASIPVSSLDRYDFYSISQYCNALVSDGKGGSEPRFSCNLLINSRDEVYNVIQIMTSIFRGIAYYGAGTMVLQQDKPSDSQYLLSPANVVDGIFSYSGTSQKSRHTTATVGYQRYDTRGEVEYEYVEDSASVAKFGVINKDIRALGCYSQGQAQRVGRWALLSEQNLTETVTFSVSLDSGIILRPGMVVDIADPVKAGERRSGRIASATTTSVDVDNSTDISNVSLATAPTLSVILPTGLIETKKVSSIVANESVTSILLQSAFSEAPNPQSIWLLQSTNIQSQQFRVLNVAEAGDGIYGVTALAYNQSIYSAIENGTKIKPRDITDLTDPPDAVTSVTGEEYLYINGQSVFAGFNLSWVAPARAFKYKVNYRIDDDNWTGVTTDTPSIEIKRTRKGIIYIEITAFAINGKASDIALFQFDLLGKTARPGDVQNLSFEPIDDTSGRLSWDETVDLDVKVGGKVHIRHSSKADGTANWSKSVDLIQAKAGNSTEAIIPLVEGEVFVKFEDDGGRKSLNAASIVIDLPDALKPLLVQTRREDLDSPPFQGTSVDVFYSDSLDALTLDGSINIDDIDDIDLLPTFDVMGDTLESGTYTFLNTLDLGDIFTLNLIRHISAEGYYPSDLIDARTALIDTWDDFDGDDASASNVQLKIRKTDDNPSGTPTWTSWDPFINGNYAARAFQFRADFVSPAIDQNIAVTELGYKAKMRRRTEQSDGPVTSNAGATTITFSSAFFVGTATLGGVNAYLPSVGITTQNLQTGDYFTINSVSATGFSITFYNSSNVAVAKNFTWTAVGYGRKS
jgi:predicted phage tail protein